jgi:hypothetical protein
MEKIPEKYFFLSGEDASELKFSETAKLRQRILTDLLGILHDGSNDDLSMPLEINAAFDDTFQKLKEIKTTEDGESLLDALLAKIKERSDNLNESGRKKMHVFSEKVKKLKEAITVSQ